MSPRVSLSGGARGRTDATREEFDEALQHAQAIYDFVLNLLRRKRDRER